MTTKALALRAWEKLNDQLNDLYARKARETRDGYDRESTNSVIDACEKAEHAAWLAYRELDKVS